MQFSLIIIFLVVVLFFFVAGSIFGSLYFSRKKGAPFYPTPARAIRDALHELGLMHGEKFYDLGAGTGKALVIAEKEFGAHAYGFEISWVYYTIARINLFLRGSHAILHKTDAFLNPINDADIIFCFFSIRSMKKMEEKIVREAKPGARIMVYAFPFPTVNPKKIIPVHGQWNMYLYEK